MLHGIRAWHDANTDTKYFNFHGMSFGKELLYTFSLYYIPPLKSCIKGKTTSFYDCSPFRWLTQDLLVIFIMLPLISKIRSHVPVSQLHTDCLKSLPSSISRVRIETLLSLQGDHEHPSPVQENWPTFSFYTIPPRPFPLLSCITTMATSKKN